MHHIVATFSIGADVPAPKVVGVRTGYAPHHKFANIVYLASGFHQYDDKEIHYPGESIKARITFPSWQYFRDGLSVGDIFEVRELERVIGYGTIDEIL